MTFIQPTDFENDYSFSDNSSNDVDIKKISKIIIRRKFLIIIVSVLSLFVGGGYSLSKKSTWEGHSQIVMKDSNTYSSLDNMRSSIKNISEPFSILDSTRTSYTTEIKILESPYILKPIYDFVKLSKERSGIETSNMTFRKWKKRNFSVKLADKSSVLNLIYRDTNKSLILPVIEKISLAYQKYSGSDREKGISQGIKFLEGQIEKAVNDSSSSMIALQDFSLENGMGNLDGLPLISNSLGKFNSNNSDLVPAKSSQVNKNNSKSDRYILKFEKLSRLEAEYLSKSAFLKPNSFILKSLKLQIDELKESLSRPKEILLEYRELVQSAALNENKLISLRNQLSQLELEEARQSTPWQLISPPTLLDDPVGPNRLRITLLTFLIGLIGSILYALRIDRLSGIIYDFIDFLKHVTYPFLLKLPLNKEEDWSNYIEIILQGTINKNDKQNINLIPLGSLIDNEKLDVLSNIFSTYSSVERVFIVKNIIESCEDRKNFLIIQSGMCTFDELSILMQKLKILKYPIVGWIYLDPEN